MNIHFEPEFETTVKIKVVGIGGGGGNAVNRMIQSGITSVEFVTINTDLQDLRSSQASTKIEIGSKSTKGRGAGGDPDKGLRAAEENREEIENALKGAQMVFITAGMGGGTGTGAAPIVAEIAHELGILTIGIVTKPFAFESKARMARAEVGIAALKENVDSLLVIPNERLNLFSETKITLANAFAMADDVLRQGVQSISDLINVNGFINLDFSDVKSVMEGAGFAHMGVGTAHGKDKADEAARAAISSPLLETSIDDATGVLINFTIPASVELEEVTIASNYIQAAVSDEANVFFGVAFDDTLEDEMRITLIATGFDHNVKKKAEPVRAIETPADAIFSQHEISDSIPSSSFEDDEFEDLLNMIKNRKIDESNNPMSN